MAIEGYLISTNEGKEFLNSVKPEHYENLGRYLRVNNEVWIMTASFPINIQQFLGLARLAVDDFTTLFKIGNADARMYVYTNPELHNQDLQMKSFRFGLRVYPSFLLEKPKIRLCGGCPDLWTNDSQSALDNSVKVFKREFPKYQITFGKTALV